MTEQTRVAGVAGYSRFEEISAEECIQLIRENAVGRVAWTAPDGPMILPISYVYSNDAIIFRTSPYGALAELVRPQQVALQVDLLDSETRTGWSVLARGRSSVVTSADEVVGLWSVEGLQPWARGVRNLFIKITPRRFSGRVVSR